MSITSSARALRILTDFEDRFPVGEWEIAGVKVWPVLRIELAVRILGVRERDGGVPPSKKRRSLRQITRPLMDYGRACIVDHGHNQRIDQPYSAVFLIANSHRRVQLDGGWYSVYSDPLVAQLEAMGHSSLVLERRSGVYNVPRHSGSKFVPPVRPLRRFRCRSAATDVDPGRVALNGYSELCERLETLHSFPAPTIDDLERRISRLRNAAEYYKRIIVRSGAQIAFAVCYYSNSGFAFNLAAREIGIPTVDIQHGVQGKYHFAYGQWTNVPEEGYRLLPSYFWCWGESERDSIRRWSGEAGPHIPIEGGNPWLSVWAARRHEFAEDSGRVEREASGAEVNVLYTHDRSPEVSQEIAAAIAQSPATWLWWVRLHPGASESTNATVSRQIRKLGGRVKIGLATQVPLYSLLSEMDVHVTKYSSIVIEAGQFQVPSVVTTTIGEEYFAEGIGAGWVKPARSPAAILRAIDECNTAKPERAVRTWEAAGTSEGAALRALLSATKTYKGQGRTGKT